MIVAPIASNERERLAELVRYKILDTPAELAFDDITRLAAQICGTPIALITLIDSGRQWFKSKLGLDFDETPRDQSFCTHAIHRAEIDDIMEVANALDDQRFYDNPLVIGPLGIRFYAGIPLITPDRFRIGTLCVLDKVSRRLAPDQRDALTRLGRQVITQLELRRTTRRVREQMSEQRAICDSLVEGLFRIDLDGLITFENASSARMFGRAGSNVIGRTAHELIQHSRPDGAPYPSGACPVCLTMRDGIPRSATDEVFWRADGSSFPVHYVTAPTHDEDGTLTGATVAFSDATALHRAATALHRAEQAQTQLAALVESAEDAIIVQTPAGVITSLNPAAERLYGYLNAELAGRPYEIVVAPARRAEELAILQRAAHGEPTSQHETERRRKDGTLVTVSATISPIKDGAERVVGISNVARDLTWQKQAEAREREHVRLFAFEAEAALALTGDDYLPAILDGCVASCVQCLDVALARIWTLDCEKTVLELKASAGQYTHLDGPHGWVRVGDLVIGRIAAERKPYVTNAVIGDPRVSDQEWATREGMISFAGLPLIAGGQLVGVMAVFARRALSELTLRAMTSVAHNVALAIERSRTTEVLHTRNEELKWFANTVSHDLKAPLRSILGYAQELSRDHHVGLSARAQFCLTQLTTATRNLDRLIEDLLQYSRIDRENPELTKVDLAATVASILSDLGHSISELGAEVSVSLPSGTVVGWDRGLRQVLANLIDNALKYSRHARPPRVSIGGEAVSGGFRISVSDNGIGFDMTFHDRLFGLFNRLVRAEDFEGTGAGLAIVKKVLQKQGGKVWAQSSPGNGATFFVELPTPWQPSVP